MSDDTPVGVSGSPPLLSFNDLVELYVVRQLRSIHKVSRTAIGEFSRSGQLAVRVLSERPMKRVVISVDGLPSVLFPEFVGEEKVGGEYPVAVTPTIAFGRPTLAGTGIKTSVLAARIDAGETVEEVAGDYGVTEVQVMNAIRFERGA